MKKLSRSSELLWLMGVIFVALGVAICSKTSLGVSMIAAPAFIINEAVSGLWSGFSVGMIEYIFQGLLLLIMCIVVRRFNWRFLLAFLVAVLYGYTLDLFLFLLRNVSFDAIWLRWIMLIVGDIATALGVACYFKTYMPLQVYELFVSEVSHKFKFDIGKTKLVFDLSLLVISITLAFSLFGDVASFDWKTIWYSSFHSIGLGTVVTTLINAPIITLWGKLLDIAFNPTALFPKFQEFISTNKESFEKNCNN